MAGVAAGPDVRVALRDAEELRQHLLDCAAEIGDDHSVNICSCAVQRLADTMDYALAKAQGLLRRCACQGHGHVLRAGVPTPDGLCGELLLPGSPAICEFCTIEGELVAP